MTDIFSAIGDGLSKVGKSAAREAKRAANEYVTHIEEDFDSVAKAIDEGGFLGGALQAADVFSPGHRLAQDLDALNVIPEDPALKELISGGVNLATASPFSLLAAKDLMDAIGAIQSSNGARQPMAPHLGAERPSLAPPATRGWSNADDVSFGDRIRGPSSGHCGGALEGYSVTREKLEDAIARMRKDLSGARDGTGSCDGELEREIQKILANPNLMFEDMIFLLMRAFIKDTRKEVTSLADDLKGTRKADHGDQRALQGQLEKARARYEAAQAKGDTQGANAAANEVQSIKERKDMSAAERSESRADKFEELKQVMQRLSEMEQALSNVLNTMHEGSMAAIRNIR